MDGAIATPDPDASVPPLAPPWTVSGSFLRDGAGRAIVQRGVNLSGKNKLPPYLDYHQAPDFARARTDWGFNSIRLVTTWAAIEPTKGNFNTTFLDALAQRVEWAKQANLLVVVDMHQDVFGEGFVQGGGDGAPTWACDASNYASFKPAALWTANYLSSQVQACYDGFWGSADLQAEYAEAWRQVATRLSKYDNVVGFDIMNEPFWGSHTIANFEHDFLAPLYERVVPAVRSVAPGWVAFIEPSTSRNFLGSTNLPKPSYPNYMYAPHSYDTQAETGAGFDPSHRDAVISNIASLWKEAQALGAGLWIGEYGGKASWSGIVEYMTAQNDGMGAVAASSEIWNYTKGGYGLLADDGSEQLLLTNTLVRPYPEAIAGTPVQWLFDVNTMSFGLWYHADPNIKTATVISVPPRIWPGGYKIECTGCKAQTVGNSVVVTQPPTGDPATIVLHP